MGGSKRPKSDTSTTGNSPIASSTPLLSTVNINNLQTHELDPDVKGTQLSVYCQLCRANFISDPVRTLLDTGAMYSVMHHQELLRLKNEGLQFEMKPTCRNRPVSASNHPLEIVGDVVLSVQFKTDKDILKIRNVRFSILRQLSCRIIIGVEVLNPLKLRIEGKSVLLLHRRVPLCDVEFRPQVEVIDWTILEDEN